MNRLCLFVIQIFLLVGLCVNGNAQLVEVVYENPGVGGMQTNYDTKMSLPVPSGGNLAINGPDYLLYNLNFDATIRPGMLKRRLPLVAYDSNTVALLGATGYNNREFNSKRVVGIKTNDSVSVLGQICFSNISEADLQDNAMSNYVFPFDDAVHDWTVVGNNLIHCDGKSTPILFTTTDSKFISQKILNQRYDHARSISLGPEAPGQPRVGLCDSTVEMCGTFVYAFAYKGSPGLQSNMIYTDGDAVIVSNLPAADTTVHGTDWVWLLRKELGGFDDWFVLDSLYHPQDSCSYYIDATSDSMTLPYRTVCFYTDGTVDSLVNCDSCVIGYQYVHCQGTKRDTFVTCLSRQGIEDYHSWGYTYILNTYCNPHFWYGVNDSTCATGLSGVVVSIDDIDSITSFADSVHHGQTATIWDSTGGPTPGQLFLATDSADTNQFSQVCYSIYDYETGIESPLGPPAHAPCDTAVDSIYGLFRTGDLANCGKDSWIRVYQTLTRATLPGGLDTTVWYCVLQARMDAIIGASRNDSIRFHWYDSQVVDGLDSCHLAAVVPVTDSTGARWYNLPRNPLVGGVITRPPHKYSCPIPASDMEFHEGRLWAIGDPLLPASIYYSSVNYPEGEGYSWSPYNRIDVTDGPQGELIAIERAEGFGRDALYLFKRNSIFLLTGGPYDMRIQMISPSIGAINKRCIVKHGGRIYFMAPGNRLRVYMLQGVDQPVDISSPIRDHLDTLFDDDRSANLDVRALRFGDNVEWFDTATDYGASFNTESGTWSVKEYLSGVYCPLLSFSYDTSSSEGAPGYSSNVMAFLGSIGLCVEGDSVMESVVDGSRTAAQFPLAGGSGRMWSVQQVELEIQAYTSPTRQIEICVLNEDKDTLCVEIVKVGPDSSEVVVVDLPANEGEYLSVLVWNGGSLAASSPIFDVKKARLTYRDMGRVNVQ